MPNPENIDGKQWKKGQSGNPSGKPKGVKNRATIMRKFLETSVNLTDKNKDALESLFPKVKGNKLKAEELIALAQLRKAITGDTNAYKAIMDSAYGMPKQQVEFDAQLGEGAIEL